MKDFFKGESVTIVTEAIDQKSQVKLNGRKGIVVYAGHSEILVNLIVRGKSRTLPFSKSELNKN